MTMLLTDAVATPAASTERRTAVVPIANPAGIADWTAMFARDAEANPFQHPDYVFAELDAASNQKSVIVRLGTQQDIDGVGILIPKSVRTNQVGGIGPSWSMRGFRLAAGSFLTSDGEPDTQSMLLAAALDHCISQRSDFLLIEDLDEQSSLWRAVQLAEGRGLRVFAARESQPRRRLKLPNTLEAYWSAFSSRTRRALRVRVKKFPDLRLERVTDAAHVPGFLAVAHEISKQSWQTRQFGLRIRNDESELRRLTALAHAGMLRSYLLWSGEKPAAFAICTQQAGIVRYEETAYCAEFGLLSPGETMLQQIIEDLFAWNPPTVMDFGGGDAEYKRRFGNAESRSQTIWLVPPTFRAGVTLRYIDTCRSVRAGTRYLVQTCGLATKARQWLRNGNWKVSRTNSAEQAEPRSEVPADEAGA